RLFTESEMQQWTSNRLLLDQQAGANLHLTAHAEGVDTLVPGGMHRARSNDLPVIIFRTVIDGFDSVAIEIDAEQIELAVAVYIRDVEHSREVERIRGNHVLFVPQRNVGAANEIERAVIVQVCGY